MVDEANTDAVDTNLDNPPQDTAPPPNQASEPPIGSGTAPEPDVTRQEIPVFAQKIMNRLHERSSQYEQQLSDARAELELLRRQAASQPSQSSQQAPATQAPALQPPQPQPVYDIETRVAQEVARREFQANADRAQEEGLRAHGDKWNAIIANIQAYGGFRDHQADLAYIINSGYAPTIMAELAKVENGTPLYEQIMSIANESKRHGRLLELVFKPSPAAAATAPSRPQSSNAPPPIDPVTGRGTHAPPPNDLYDPKFNSDQLDQEWHRIRNEQKYARFQRMNGR